MKHQSIVVTLSLVGLALVAEASSVRKSITWSHDPSAAAGSNFETTVTATSSGTVTVKYSIDDVLKQTTRVDPLPGKAVFAVPYGSTGQMLTVEVSNGTDTYSWSVTIS